MKDLDRCKRCARRTGVLGLAVGVCLAAFKLSIGYIGGSRALIGSGLCALSDIFSSFMVFVGIRYSRKSPNLKYPYGYGKIEFIVQLSMSLFMIAGAAPLLMVSFLDIARRSVIVPHWVVFFTAVLCAVFNGLMYKYASCGAREINSPSLRSHAEHNKIDLASSLLVAVGTVATRYGMHWADPLIAIFECAHVIRGSSAIFWSGLKGVMDTSLPEQFKEHVRGCAMEIEQIRSVNKVLARQSGERIFLDVAIALDPDLPVLEAKQVVQDFKSKLRKRRMYSSNICVQIVPAE